MAKKKKNKPEEEGKALKHCVATYANSCFKEKCSIWAMEKENVNGLLKCVTVEVDSNGVIVQARGMCNRLPNSVELTILNKWAFDNKLTLSQYIHCGN